MDNTSDPLRNEYDVLALVRKLQKKCVRQEQELAKLRGELAGRNVTSIKRAITITSTVEFDEFFPNRVPKSALANAGTIPDINTRPETSKRWGPSSGYHKGNNRTLGQG